MTSPYKIAIRHARVVDLAELGIPQDIVSTAGGWKSLSDTEFQGVYSRLQASFGLGSLLKHRIALYVFAVVLAALGAQLVRSILSPNGLSMTLWDIPMSASQVAGYVLLAIPLYWLLSYLLDWVLGPRRLLQKLLAPAIVQPGAQGWALEAIEWHPELAQYRNEVKARGRYLTLLDIKYILLRAKQLGYTQPS